MSNCYGRLDFLFGNATVRQKAYDEIYQGIRNFQNECIAQSNHFELLRKKQGNLLVCISKLEELDKKAFTEEGGAVYRTLYDNLGRSLEDFRSKIYGKAPEYDERHPVSERFDMKKLRNGETTDISEMNKQVEEIESDENESTL